MPNSLGVAGSKQAILELGFCFLCLLAIEFGVTGPSSFVSLNPNPFWIPVILGSAQYGATAGIVCTFVASILSYLGGLPEPKAGADFYERYLYMWRDPTLWLITSLVVGQIQQRQMSRWNALRESHEQIELERQEIASYCEKLEGRYRTLERKIATGETINSVASRLLELRNSSPESQNAAFRKLISLCLGPCSYCVCLGSGSGTTKWLTECPPKSYEALLATYQQVYDALKKERQILSVLDSAATPLQSALFATPIFDRHTGNLLGVLFITAMEPDAIDERSEAALKLLAMELSEAAGHVVGTRMERLRV